MTEKLRRFDVLKSIGDDLFIDIRNTPNSQLTKVVRWDGSIKAESIKWWKSRADVKRVEVRANCFFLGEYELPVEGELVGVLLEKDVFTALKQIGEANTFKILTRKPLTDFEKKLNRRVPVVLNGNAIRKYEEKDVK